MRLEANSTTGSHARAQATLIISGEFVEPDFWTRYFGVAPSSVRTKGERYTFPSGKLSSQPAKVGFWSFESKSHIQCDRLAPHLRYLKSALALPREDLRGLLQAQGAKLALWCYWINDSGDRVPDVPPDIRAMMDALGGTIEIDEYR